MAARPPLGCSVPNMVERYLGTEYDTVKLVADNIDYIVKVASSLVAGQYFQLPVGPTSIRPTNPKNGMIRFNSDIPGYEGYNTDKWSGLGSENNSTDGGATSLSFVLAARITADGSETVFNFGEVDYVDETTIFVFADTGFQRPITDFTVGAEGTANQGKLVMRSAPPAGTVIDVVRLVGTAVITDAGKITFSATVPDPEVVLTPWFVNITTGKMYYKVAGENATYWVELNSNGEL